MRTDNKMNFTADRYYTALTDRRAAGNSGFKKLAIQWLSQVQFFNQTFVQVDSFVLRNRQLLKPAKRYAQPYCDRASGTSSAFNPTNFQYF